MVVADWIVAPKWGAVSYYGFPREASISSIGDSLIFNHNHKVWLRYTVHHSECFCFAHYSTTVNYAIRYISKELNSCFQLCAKWCLPKHCNFSTFLMFGISLMFILDLLNLHVLRNLRKVQCVYKDITANTKPTLAMTCKMPHEEALTSNKKMTNLYQKAWVLGPRPWVMNSELNLKGC